MLNTSIWPIDWTQSDATTPVSRVDPGGESNKRVLPNSLKLHHQIV